MSTEHFQRPCSRCGKMTCVAFLYVQPPSHEDVCAECAGRYPAGPCDCDAESRGVSTKHTVEVGQVYEETDLRARGRRFEILRVADGYAEVRTLGARKVGRIRLDRLQPTLGKRGYRRVEVMGP